MNNMNVEQAPYQIHRIPVSERPRERLMHLGVDALSTADLIAVILGSGIKGAPILALAQQIVSHFGSLEKLAEASIAELCQIHGMGPAKAIQLLASIGLGKKLARRPMSNRIRISSPSHVYELLRDEMEDQKQEHFVVVLMDAKNWLICRETVSIGTLSETLTHPREVFFPAIRHKAAALVLAHNHPSGDPTPSPSDHIVTQELIAAGALMGIPVRDHIIIGKGKYLSLRQENQYFSKE